MKSLISRVRSFIGVGIWDEDLGQLPFWRAAPLRLIRDGALAVRGYREHQLGIRSAALTYITVLSLVPMLAFAFSVAKGFGLYDRLIDDVVVEFLDTYFGEELPIAEPEPEVAIEIPESVGPDEPGLEGSGAPDAGGGLDGGESASVGEEPAGEELLASVEGGLGSLDPEPVDGLPPSDGVGSSDPPLDAPQAETEGTEGDELAAAELESGGEPDGEPGGGAPTPATGGQSSQVREAINQVLAFVEATDVTSLGTFGLVVLFAAVLRLLGQVEAALNMIWGIAKPRPFLRKLTDYLAMVVVAPILALTATAVKASSNSSELMDSLRETAAVGGLIEALFGLAPLFVMWLVFTLVFLVMPNTRVRPFSAMLGGFVAAIVWSIVQELYVKSQVGVSSYSNLYAGFAAFPLFLLWAYLSWMSMLIGAEFAHADQSQAAYRRTAITRNSSAAYFEAAILTAVGRIAERFEYGGEPIPLDRLVDAVEIPEHTLRDGFELLVEGGLLVEAQEATGPTYVLGRAADRIRVFDVLSTLRGSYPEEFAAGHVALDQRVADAARGVEAAQAESGSNRTLRDLVTEARVAEGSVAEGAPAEARQAGTGDGTRDAEAGQGRQSLA